MDDIKQEKMTKTWRDRAWGATFTMLIAIVPIFLAFKLAVNYDESQAVINQLQNLERNKMDIVDFKVEKKEILDYIDIGDEKTANEINSKLDIFIKHQKETIELLKEINQQTK